VTLLIAETDRPADRLAAAGFEVGYVSEDGTPHRLPLSEVWAVPLEHGLPVRRFASRKGQRHLSGLWWSAIVSDHVGFESWLEGDQLVAIDFDSSVVGIALRRRARPNPGWPAGDDRCRSAAGSAVGAHVDG
jgi:hypothetical protein